MHKEQENRMIEALEQIGDALKGKPWPLDKPDSIQYSFERIADALTKIADGRGPWKGKYQD